MGDILVTAWDTEAILGITKVLAVILMVMVLVMTVIRTIKDMGPIAKDTKLPYYLYMLHSGEDYKLNKKENGAIRLIPICSTLILRNFFSLLFLD